MCIALFSSSVFSPLILLRKSFLFYFTSFNEFHNRQCEARLCSFVFGLFFVTYMFFVALSKSVIPFCTKFTSLSAWLMNLVVLLIYIFHRHVRCMYLLFFPFLSKETASCLLPYPSVDFICS